MSMSANFHNVERVCLDDLHTTNFGSHPCLELHDANGSYIAVHLRDDGLDKLEAAIAEYRAAQAPKLEQAA